MDEKLKELVHLKKQVTNWIIACIVLETVQSKIKINIKNAAMVTTVVSRRLQPTSSPLSHGLSWSKRCETQHASSLG